MSNLTFYVVTTDRIAGSTYIKYSPDFATGMIDLLCKNPQAVCHTKFTRDEVLEIWRRGLSHPRALPIELKGIAV